MAAKKHKKIGLALGGGGARALAHIGVIRALRDFGITPDYIAGTSMGSVIGGWFCAGEPLEDLEKIFFKAKESGLLPKTKIFLKRDGMLFKDFEIQSSIEDRLSHLRVEKSKIPFSAVATNIKDGDQVVLNKGSLNFALKASSALPLAFKPVKDEDGRLLIDGVFSNPVPADVVRKMGADIVIAVNVSSRWANLDQEIKLSNVRSVVENSLQAAEYQLARVHLKDADIVLSPAVSHLSWLDFGSINEIITAGYEETRSNMKNIFKVCGLKLPKKTLLDKLADFVLNKD